VPSGQATAAPPSSVMNSRRLKLTMRLTPPACPNLPRRGRQVVGAHLKLNVLKSSRGGGQRPHSIVSEAASSRCQQGFPSARRSVSVIRTRVISIGRLPATMRLDFDRASQSAVALKPYLLEQSEGRSRISVALPRC
jgi:hypothetical protein